MNMQTQLNNGSPNGKEDKVSLVLDDIHQELQTKRVEVLRMLQRIDKSKDRKKDKKEIDDRIEFLAGLQKIFNEIMNSHSRMIRYHKLTGTHMQNSSEELLKQLEGIKSTMGSIEQIVPKT